MVCTSDPRYTDALHVGTNAFDRDAAVKAIKDFCGKNLLFDPDVKDNTSSLSQYGDWPTGIAKGSGKAGTGIDVNASTLCKGQDTPKNQKFETGGLDCTHNVQSLIIDKCDVKPGDKKKEGSLISSVSKTSFSVSRVSA